MPPRVSEAGGGGRQSKLRTARLSLPETAPAPQALLRQLDLARQRLDRLTDLLSVVADSYERLSVKIARAEQTLLDPDFDLSDLKAEVELFKAVCRALRWGRRP
jgi:hypothetical protein